MNKSKIEKRPAGTEADSDKMPKLTMSSQNNAKPNVIGSVFCLFGKHKWGGEYFNVCQRCNKKAVGLPKFENPPPCPLPLNPAHHLKEAVVVVEVEVVVEDCEKSEDCSP